eukprot:CAMPEP_0170484456 /NCGR_PEP_ID=MMETSP0208-20121228/3930_1 /TAXON_ID=197538 /ORGANISM="Strombidium inclinatum, Strain S3" /LENGTH=132 /DNA_ID=CAMNT_0010757793 /DNA_START=1391 /DNA_END=1789 /DNA_ORIENTATION=-
MTDQVKKEIAHTNKKVIDLDDTGQESSEVDEDTLDQELDPTAFTSLNTLNPTQQQLCNSSGSGERDQPNDHNFTPYSVQRSIRKSMFKIKLQKSRKRALLFEKVDDTGQKFNSAIRQYAFKGQFKRIKLTPA